LKRKLLLFVLSSLFLTAPIKAKEEKPVEAWISYKQVDGKVVEVVKVKTDSGKVYEFYPGLSPNEIPKPKNELPNRVSSKLFLVSLGFLMGLFVGTAVLWVKLKRLKEE